jgi:hypothetical protein
LGLFDFILFSFLEGFFFVWVSSWGGLWLLDSSSCCIVLFLLLTEIRFHERRKIFILPIRDQNPLYRFWWVGRHGLVKINDGQGSKPEARETFPLQK